MIAWGVGSSYSRVLHKLTSFEIDCFYCLWTRIYEYTPTPPSYRACYGHAIYSFVVTLNRKLGGGGGAWWVAVYFQPRSHMSKKKVPILAVILNNVFKSKVVLWYTGLYFLQAAEEGAQNTAKMQAQAGRASYIGSGVLSEQMPARLVWHYGWKQLGQL